MRLQPNLNLDAAREAYAQTYEAPSPEQLVALRARFGASQKAFGLILGLGELTMNSYEQGAIPAPANRLLLILQQVVAYVSAGSFEEYSNLIQGAAWSASSARPIDQGATLAPDTMKAAS